MKNDRYDDGLYCKRLFFENSNNTYTIAKIDENIAKILNRIISDEYEATPKTLKELQEQIKIMKGLANQFTEQVSIIILYANNFGLKGKCIIGV